MEFAYATAPTFQASVGHSGGSEGSTTCTFDVNVTADTDIIVVLIESDETISSVADEDLQTYTQETSATGNDNVYIYTTDNPTTNAANTVTVTLSTSADTTCFGVTYSGVDPTNPVGSVGSASFTATSDSITYSTTYDDSEILHICGNQNTSTITWDTGKTLEQLESNGGANKFMGAIARESTTTAGSNNASCDPSKNGDSAHAVIEIQGETVSEPTYVVDLLDVYESSSTTLGSGTAVCLDVDLETASDCNGITTATVVDAQSVTTEETQPQGLDFSTDGTKMFVLGSTGSDVNEYTCSTGWDVSTCTTFVDSKSVTDADTDPRSLKFSYDGHKMWIGGATNQDVGEYSCTSPWDVSTCSYVDLLDTSSQASGIISISDWSTDGTKFFSMDHGDSVVDEWDCDPFDVSTCTYNSSSSSLTSQDTLPIGGDFTNDGKKYYFIGNTDDEINEYTCSAAWDISTCTFSGVFDVTVDEDNPTNIKISTDGKKIMLLGNGVDDVTEYTLNAPLKINTDYRFEVEVDNTGTGAGSPTRLDADSVVAVGDVFGSIISGDIINSGCSTNTDWTEAVSSTEVQVSSGTTCSIGVSGNAEFWFIVNIDPDAADGDTTFSITDGSFSDVSTATSFDITTPVYVTTLMDVYESASTTLGSGTEVCADVGVGYDNECQGITTASFVDVLGITVEETNAQDMIFSNDGTKMLTVGVGVGGDIHEYTCTAWDVSTCSNIDSFDMASQDTNPNSLFVSPDGKKLFVGGNDGNDVNEYVCTTGWDLSTCSFVDSFAVNLDPTGLDWSSDGVKMMVQETDYLTTSNVREYTCDSYDISTCSFVDSFAVSSQAPDARGMTWKTDGTVMYIVGEDNDAVYEYSCTAWDVSTCSYTYDSFSVSGQTGLPRDVSLSLDNTKLYVLAGDEINEYDLNSPLKINTSYRFEYEVTNIGGVSGSPDQTLTYDSVGEPFDLTTSNFVYELDTSSDNTQQASITWKPDGTRMFTVDDNSVGSTQDFQEYECSTAWDLSSCTFTDATDIDLNTSEVRGHSWNGDGTKVYFVSSDADQIDEYSCTAWDASTCTYTDNLSITTNSPFPMGVTWNNDGSYMYVADLTNIDVNTYTCTTLFDASTCSFKEAFDFVTNTPTVRDLIWKYDGLKFFIVDNTNDQIDEYQCTTAWETSTCTYNTNIDYSSITGGTSGQGVAISTDGTKLYIANNGATPDDSILEYDIGGLFGEITATDVTNSGCSTNTNWVDSIASSVDVQTVDGTTCSLASGGSAEYWYIVSPDTTATDDDITFEVSDVDGFTGSSADVFLDVTKPLFVFDELDVYESASTTLDSGTGICTDVNFYGDYCTGWNVSGYTLNGDLSVSGQDGTMIGMEWSNDGLILVTVGTVSNDVFQYNCTTAFDIDTCSYDSTNTINLDHPTGVTFSNDGLLMYVMENTADAIHEYGCTTAFDISTCTTNSSVLDVTTQEANPTAIEWNDDGTKMFVQGLDVPSILEYGGCTAWDVSTCTYTDEFNISAQASTNGYGLDFTPDGTVMWVAESDSDEMHKYKCSPYDVSTCSFEKTVSIEAVSNLGTTFSRDGTKFYSIDAAGDTVDQYDLTALETSKTYRFEVDVTNIGGMSTSADVFSMLSSVDGGYDVINLAQFKSTFDHSAQSTLYSAISWNDDGTKFYGTDNPNTDIDEWGCTTAYDLSSCTYTDTLDVNSQSTSPYGMTWNTDGTKMFHTDNTGDQVEEYSCTAFDVSTCSHTDSTSVTAHDTAPLGLDWNNDGTKMFTGGNNGKDIGEWSCTAFDASTCTFTDAFSVPQVATVVGIEFNGDGTKLFVTDNDGDDDINVYSCTAFDVSTCSFDGSFVTLEWDDEATDVIFNADGTKMYVGGNTNDSVFTFDVANLFGSITATDVTSSGCSTNTNWTDSIVSSVDIQLDAGTTCTNTVGGTNTYWFIATIDDDAPQTDTASFKIDDGTTSNTSSLANFSIKNVSTINYTKQITDNLGVIDSQDFAVLLNFADPMGITDNVFTSAGRSSSKSDSLGVTDNITTTEGKLNIESDNLGVTDNITTTITRLNTESDNLGLTDVLRFDIVDKHSDNLGMTDLVTATVIIINTESDNLGITDGITTTVVRNLTFVEEVDVLDDDVVDADRFNTESDPLGITDNVNTIWTRYNAESDPLGVTDNVSTFEGKLNTESDNLGMTDALRFDIVDKHSDNLGMTDGITTTVVRNLTFVEEVDVLDDDVVDADRFNTESDNLGVTDSVSTVWTKYNAESDNLGVTDSVSTVWTKYNTESDNLGMTDGQQYHIVKKISDNLGLTDNTTEICTGCGDQFNSESDNLGMTDSLRFDIVDTHSDNLGITDGITTTVVRNLTFVEEVDVLDDDVVDADRFNTESDNLGVTDSVSTSAGRSDSESDNLGLVDSINTSTGRLNPESDLLGLTDFANATKISTVKWINATEAINVSDEVTEIGLFVYDPTGKYIWFKVAEPSANTRGGVFSSMCDTTEIVIGINGTGYVKCVELIAPTNVTRGGIYEEACPSGEYVSGIDTNGNLICSDPTP